MADALPPYSSTPSGDDYAYNDNVEKSQSHPTPASDGYQQHPGQQYPAGGIPYATTQQPYGGQSTAFAPSHGQQSQPSYGSIAQPVHTTVLTVPVAVYGQPRVSEFPCHTTCPHCFAQVVTNTNYVPGALTWLVCGALLFFGCWLGCCLIPFVVDDCKDVMHSCPNCNNIIGIYKRL